MKKYLILFLAVFICVFCKKDNRAERMVYERISYGNVAEDSVEYDDSRDVAEHYTQILLKKCQESGNRREPIKMIDGRIKILKLEESFDVDRNALKEYYDIDLKEGDNARTLLRLTNLTIPKRNMV